MSRVQLALNVDDLEASVDFYSKLFNTTPAKRHDGYANFAIDNPPLKLVLVEGEADGNTINHLGVEVPDTASVASASERLSTAGLGTREEDQVTCCYAVQDKVWVNAPGGLDWEIYTVLENADSMESDGCCLPSAESTATAAASDSACC
ncbi:UNVERIFIED_CONTAM: hypothetical protein GTU68_053845 [Idotea baltica]|nr:hypothetical protein [Idotea baltica]